MATRVNSIRQLPLCGASYGTHRAHVHSRLLTPLPSSMSWRPTSAGKGTSQTGPDTTASIKTKTNRWSFPPSLSDDLSRTSAFIQQFCTPPHHRHNCTKNDRTAPVVLDVRVTLPCGRHPSR
ncbi:hypothetical protein BC835DRAFT_711335 [Cytidiella melzeri]|nr:hypothetical protein BC835DRAFT_711335 [Cytidiella melzeri]